MFDKILVPVDMDHSKSFGQSIEIARTLLKTGGTITFLHVLEETPGWVSASVASGLTDRARDSAKAELEKIAEEAGDDCGSAVIYGHAGRTIVDYAQTNNCDCVVVLSHRPGLSDYFLGSTAATVARHAACSVVVVR